MPDDAPVTSTFFPSNETAMSKLLPDVTAPSTPTRQHPDAQYPDAQHQDVQYPDAIACAVVRRGW
jgi:hypothetical protein